MGFERQELREIRAELEKAISRHQEWHNKLDIKSLSKYNFDVGNCSYNDSKATFKLEVTIKGAKSEERVALEKFADYCGLDLNKDHPEWILVGYNRKARDYPILMEKKSNGKTYKFTLESAKQMFKKEVA
tara:strand:+ start:94 stop:483 length:390 start_codon:yes stop_codon:yes gene_type:complete